jgi:hypothetical protein
MKPNFGVSRIVHLLVVSAAALTGCAQAPKPLYHWDGYQRQVYEYLKGDGATPAEQMLAMQAQAEKARASASALPPGFRAHVGMLHMQLGRFDEARQMLEAEKLAFPESAKYMDFLLKRMSEKKS